MSIVIVALVCALGALTLYRLWRDRGWEVRMAESIAEAMETVVHRQDERIRKRVERADGQEPDAQRTQQTRPLAPGDSWPGGT